MLEILWPVVDSQLASSDPLPEPPGDVFAAAAEPRQSRSPRMRSGAARLRPSLCAHSVRRLPGAPAGRTSTRLGADSPPPLSAEGTLQAKAAACWIPAGIRTSAVTSAFARREHSYRARRAAGSAEVADQAQNVRWRNRPAATAQQCESLLDVAGQKPPGAGRRRSRLARRTFVPARH